MKEEYDIFISYSRKDYLDEQNQIIPGNVVSKIKARIDEEGFSYWFDEEGVNYGQDFIERIVSNIEASKVFLFLSTKNSNQSQWTCKEIASADMYKKYILPVRIDHSPYNKKVMFRISDLNYIDYSVNPEKGLNDLITAIKTHLLELEQEKLYEDIRVECETFDNEAKRLEVKREKLLQEIMTHVTTEHQDELLVLIHSPKLQQVSGNESLQKENKLLKEKIRRLESAPSAKELYEENGFIRAIKTCFHKYAVFSGRASRSEFWWWYLFYFTLRLVCVILFAQYMDTFHTLRTDMSLIAYFVVFLGGLLPTIAVSVRRCHDTNHNGWWILLPIYNVIILCMPTKV